MIITHTSPDMDAIAAVWLLRRYAGLDNADVAFVSAAQLNEPWFATATAVVDCGQQLEPDTLRFDHHQLPGEAALATCATAQVGEWLQLDHPPVRAVVELVLAGDSAGRYGDKDAWLWSRESGPHAVLSSLKARRLDDIELLMAGEAMLDHLVAHGMYRLIESVPVHDFGDGTYAALPTAVLLDERRQALAQARAELERCEVYRSEDGQLIALDGAGRAASFLANELGARLVLFHSVSPDGVVAVGCQRAPEATSPHVGELVTTILALAGEYYDDDRVAAATVDELHRWYRHPAGFYAGRGSAKAPNEYDRLPLPAPLTLRHLAAWFDEAWPR